jgi:hypothetical protein
MEKLIPTQQFFMSLSAGVILKNVQKISGFVGTPIDIARVLHEIFFILEKLHKKVLEKIKIRSMC